MLTHSFKFGFILTALSISFAGQAAESKDFCDPNFMACGIQFTSIPATPSLASGDNLTSSAYVITNVSSTAISLGSVSLKRISDDTVGAGAVAFDSGLTTCSASTTLDPSGSCSIYLDFEPTSGGLLDWNLIVTPNSSQRPLVWNISTAVSGTSTPFALVGGVYYTSAYYSYPLATLSRDVGSGIAPIKPYH